MRVVVFRAWTGGFVDQQIQAMRFNGIVVDVVTLPLCNGPKILVSLFSAITGVCYSITKLYKHDAILSYSAWPSGIASMMASLVTRTPFYIYEHLSPPERLKDMPLMRGVFLRATAVSSPELRHANTLTRLFNRAVSIVPNLVKSTVMREDRGYVLAVGRLEPQKGFDRIRNWASLLPKRNFMIVGTGSMSKQIRKTSLPNMLIMDEAIAHSRVLEMISRASCVICPSEHESFGLVAAEAAATGIPVVATPCGIHEKVATEILESSYSAWWPEAIESSIRTRGHKRVMPGTTEREFSDNMLAFLSTSQEG